MGPRSRQRLFAAWYFCIGAGFLLLGIRAFLLGDFVVVRLQGLLTPAEQQLARIPSEKGRDLLKQVRAHLIETAKPHMQALVQKITGVKVVSLHHDISTVTGEAFILFTLAEPPLYRQAKNK